MASALRLRHEEIIAADIADIMISFNIFIMYMVLL